MKNSNNEFIVVSYKWELVWKHAKVGTLPSSTSKCVTCKGGENLSHSKSLTEIHFIYRATEIDWSSTLKHKRRGKQFPKRCRPFTIVKFSLLDIWLAEATAAKELQNPTFMTNNNGCCLGNIKLRLPHSTCKYKFMF